VRLLDVNENAPEDWRLDLEELDLNVAYRQKFREQSKTERQQYRVKVVRDMAEFEVQKNAIIKEHWECLFVKPKSIHVSAIKSYSNDTVCLTPAFRCISVFQ